MSHTFSTFVGLKYLLKIAPHLGQVTLPEILLTAVSNEIVK